MEKSCDIYGPFKLNCTGDATNYIKINSTAKDSKMELYDLILLNVSDVNNPRILKSDFVSEKKDYPKITTNISRIILNSTNNYFALKNDTFNYASGNTATYYFVNKVLLGDVKLYFNTSDYKANLGTTAPGTNFISSSVDTKFNEEGKGVKVIINNTNYENKDTIIYFKNYPINREYFNYKNFDYSKVNTVSTLINVYPYYNIKIGYNPRESFLKNCLTTRNLYGWINQRII